MAVLVHDEAKGAGEVGLEGLDIDLAVALAGMPIAGLEQSALRRHRHVQRRARNELLVVHIAGVRERRGAVDFAFRWSDPHAAEERPQRQLDARSELAD